VDKKAEHLGVRLRLFEMLTGHRMFEMRTVSDTMAAVLMREPDWKRAPPNLNPAHPPALNGAWAEEARSRCKAAWRSQADLTKNPFPIRTVCLHSLQSTEPRQNGCGSGLAWWRLRLFVGLIIAGIAVWKMKPSEPRQVIRLDYELPKARVRRS